MRRDDRRPDDSDVTIRQIVERDRADWVRLREALSKPPKPVRAPEDIMRSRATQRSTTRAASLLISRWGTLK